jgi:hypothetical protein
MCSMYAFTFTVKEVLGDTTICPISFSSSPMHLYLNHFNPHTAALLLFAVFSLGLSLSLSVHFN